MQVKTIGIDLAKEIFHLHGVDKNGNKVFAMKLKRKELPTFIANLKPCLIGMESCGGSNYWARKFRAMGHNAKIMQAQFVKPFVKSNKNDRIDAEAICEAVSRPNMRFAPIKDIWQQDIQTLHRVRQRLIENKTALSNSIRGLLMEYGVTIPKGYKSLKIYIHLALEDSQNELTDFSRQLFFNRYEEFKKIEEEILTCDKEIQKLHLSNEKCQKIATIPGVGPITATAVIAQIGNGRDFKNGREYAAYLGLVPRHSGTGGKTKNLSISKRGDKYIRTQMVHGSRSILILARSRTDVLSVWGNKLREKRGFNKACVALANKKARTIWAVLAHGTEYRAN
jgi:transposase